MTSYAFSQIAWCFFMASHLCGISRKLGGVIDKCIAHDTVVLCHMYFGKIIGYVSTTTLPCNSEMSLSNSISYPMKTHVHSA
jgi:hypothetical protein